MSRIVLACMLFTCLAYPASAGTTLVISGIQPTYKVDAGVTFTVGNSGFTHYVLSWTDSSGSFSANDPYLILSEGQTYVFNRTADTHPFGIENSSMPTTLNADGTLHRNTTSPATYLVSNGSGVWGTLSGNPATLTSGVLTWTPLAGNYFYTCQVTTHQDMISGVQVVPDPSGLSLIATGGLFLIRRRRIAA